MSLRCEAARRRTCTRAPRLSGRMRARLLLPRAHLQDLHRPARSRTHFDPWAFLCTSRHLMSEVASGDVVSKLKAAEQKWIKLAPHLAESLKPIAAQAVRLWHAPPHSSVPCHERADETRSPNRRRRRCVKHTSRLLRPSPSC
jgi:hypothetical protein